MRANYSQLFKVEFGPFKVGPKQDKVRAACHTLDLLNDLCTHRFFKPLETNSVLSVSVPQITTFALNVLPGPMKSNQMVSVSPIWQLGHVEKGPDPFAESPYLLR